MTSASEINKLTKIVTNEPEDKIFCRFIESVNLDIVHMNQLIDDYNQNQNDEDTRNQLVDKINRYRLEMNNKYNLRHIAKCQSYVDQIYNTLFIDIQNQLKNRHSSMAPQNTDLLTQSIANMENNDLSQFIGALWQNNSRMNSALNSINSINVLLRNYKLESLTKGMEGNSRNIKITNQKNPPLVLKVDCRLGQPSSAEMELRNKNVTYLTKIYGETRQGIFAAPDLSNMAAHVVLTDFHPKGDLEKEALTNFDMIPVDKQARACHLYLRMANIMQDMLANNVAFPDAKNSNWLISDKDELILADTKSFAHVNESGELDYCDKKNQWISRVFSWSHLPMELRSKRPPFSVDKMNAYMLGKNLYQYLTGCHAPELVEINDPSQIDVNNSVFRDEKGQMFKHLIQKLLEVNPQNRPSLKIAICALEEINKVFQSKTDISFTCFKIKFECFEKLDKINSMPGSISEYSQIKEFVDSLYEPSLSLEQLNGSNSELEKILKITEEVSKTIKHFESSWFYNKDAATQKAKNIRTTFEAIPLKDRAHIFDTDKAENPLFIAFKKALAAHRLGATDKKNKASFDIKTNQIDSEKAAATYKKFKEKFEKITKECETSVNQDNTEKPGGLKP